MCNPRRCRNQEDPGGETLWGLSFSLQGFELDGYNHNMNVEEKSQRVAGIKWYHCIDLGDGIITPGANPHNFFDALKLPASLKGKTVLDIGAWDGYYSFRCEQLGASVLATDSHSWDGSGWGTKDGFLLAREILESTVEDYDIAPNQIAPMSVGVFDIVLLLGVIYHLRNPVDALERAWDVTKETLVVETHIDETIGNDKPYAVFYPGKELNNDPTNWWGPNRMCMEGMLRTLTPVPSKVELVRWTGGVYGRAIYKAWR